MLKIMLDPGHGHNVNRSPLDATFYEGANNYSIAIALKDALLGYDGVEVMMTRDAVTDNPSLDQRGKMAVEKGCDVFFSIHSNASSDSSAYGVEGYYSITTPNAYSLLANLCNICKDYLPGSKIRRVVTKVSGGVDYYGVLRSSVGVKYSMLIEQGFHTNPNELGCIRLEEWHRAVAEQYARAFADFFGLVKKESPVNPTEEEETINDITLELATISERLKEISEILKK